MRVQSKYGIVLYEFTNIEQIEALYNKYIKFKTGKATE